MAITDGFAHYVCDRCGKEAYLLPSSAEASTWSKVQRVSVDKSTSSDPVTAYTMCSDCRNDYIAFDRPQDDAFSAFMTEPAQQRAADEQAAKAEADRKTQEESAQHAQEIADAEARGRAEQRQADEAEIAAAKANKDGDDKADDDKTPDQSQSDGTTPSEPDGKTGSAVAVPPADAPAQPDDSSDSTTDSTTQSNDTTSDTTTQDGDTK